MLQDLAVYIHWPFCQSKCPYCDFNSHVAAAIDHAHWREAYRREIAWYASLLPNRRITSVFFGGGTPSLMEAETVQCILSELARHWPLTPDTEITLEANPTSVEAEKFMNFRQAGINRLSLGIQSLRDEALRFLGRAHDAGQAKQAIALAAKHFPRFSFDLIYARKDQTPETWREELQEALRMTGGHLSAYQLTIEPNTAFYTAAGKGEILNCSEDHAAEMFEETQSILAEFGMPSYEISNHAKPGHESRHNLAYWRYDDYIGIGPGAHGRYRSADGRVATEAHRSPDVWLRNVKENGHGLKIEAPLQNPTARTEAFMMGLRLTNGIDRKEWHSKFGQDLDLSLDGVKKQAMIEAGYLIDSPDTLRATGAGRQRLNSVLSFLAV